MELFENEKVIVGEVGKNLVLTTYRLRHESEKGGHGRVTSMMLENIGACALTSDSRLSFLLLAVLVAAGALFAMAADLFVKIGVVGVVLLCVTAAIVIAYFLKRKVGIAITSISGTTIFLDARGNIPEARAVIEKVEAAQHARLLARSRAG